MTDERLDLPPHSVETEENLLGALLMNPGQLAIVRAFLTAEDFYTVRHGWVYSVMCSLHDAGADIDTRTVAEGLRVQRDPTGKHANRLEAIGGEAYLNYLPSNVPTALHAEIYGRIVQRAAIRRKLLGAAGELSMLAYNEDKALDEIIPEVAALVDDVLSQWRGVDAGPRHVRDHLQQFYDGVSIGSKISTGLEGLDNHLQGGWRGGRYNIITGRPGMCKTLLMLWSALKAARDGYQVLFVTLEMLTFECVMRLLSVCTHLDYKELEIEIAKQPLREAPKDVRLINALTLLHDLPLYFSETAKTPIALLNEIKEIDADIVFVDRIGLMRTGVSIRDHNSGRERLNYISGYMHEYAKDLEIPFVVAAQLNRKCEERHNKRPIQSDLKESGNIEQDADVICALYRNDVYYAGGNGYIELGIIKQRYGPTGRYLAQVDLPTQTVADTTQDEWKTYEMEIK